MTGAKTKSSTVFASTAGRPVYARDIFVGPKGTQFGGHLGDATIQQISRDLSPGAWMTMLEGKKQVIPPVADGSKMSQFMDGCGRKQKLSPRPDMDVEEASILSERPRKGERLLSFDIC